MVATPLPPIIETAILSLCVCLPIIAIRKFKWVSSATSRKLLHICMAPVYILCWSIFPDDNSGMYQAMLIPLAFTIVFWVIGKGFVKVDMVTDSMSRSGVASELVGGPVHYGVCISLATLFYWKRVECLYSILPIAFGDGFSAFFGPNVPGNRFLPWNPSKTWFGLASFVFFSWISLVFYNWMILKEGSFFNSDVNYVVNSLFVSVMCGLMESLTIPNYDNYTIFFMGILAFHFVHSLVCETNHLEGPKNNQFCRILYSKAARRREQSQPLPQPQIIYFPLFAFSSNAPKCTGKKGIKRHVAF